jgi:hypothetical protein
VENGERLRRYSGALYCNPLLQRVLQSTGSAVVLYSVLLARRRGGAVVNRPAGVLRGPGLFLCLGKITHLRDAGELVLCVVPMQARKLT